MKDVLFYTDTDHNRSVFFKVKDDRSLLLTVKSSCMDKSDVNRTPEYTIVINNARERNKLKELELELKKETSLRNQFSQFYVITLIMFFLIACIPNTSTFSPDNQIAATWGWLVLFILPILGFIKKTGLSLADSGITINNLKKNIIEGCLLSIFLSALMVFYRYCTIAPGEQFVSWKSFSSFSTFQFYLYISTYWIHCYIQEFIARGVLQGLIQKFFEDSHFLFPIVLISFLFCAVHVQKSYYFAAITFVISIFFGCIYYRHKNLIGVSIVHYITGILAIAFGFY